MTEKELALQHLTQAITKLERACDHVCKIEDILGSSTSESLFRLRIDVLHNHLQLKDWICRLEQFEVLLEGA